MSDKIEIVLDADVIIHFSQGGYLHLLPKGLLNPAGICYLCGSMPDDLTQNYLGALVEREAVTFEKI